MRRRAFGLRPVPSLPSRPFGFNPSRLRACGAARFACLQGESPAGYPRRAQLGAPMRAPNRLAPDRPDRRPAAKCGAGGYAPACCAGLCKCVPSSMLAVCLRNVMRDGSPIRRSALPWSFHIAPQACRHRMRQGQSPLSLAQRTLPASGASRRSRRRWDAEATTVPLRGGRPMRPWLVVNPGGGTAAPRASWLQPFGANNFPAAARLPRGTNSMRLPVLHCVSAASGAARPFPA